MSNIPSSPSAAPELAPLLNLLAVVGRAAPSTLATLFGAPLPPSHWSSLARQPGVNEAGGELVLLPTIAEARLEALEQQDRLHYRRLHQEAINLLAKDL